MALLGRIPDAIIEEVKRRNDIVSVVEQYVTLTKKTGANYFGLCPFHGEDTPSFSVSPRKQIYYCFGCHNGGDVIRFIMEMEKLSYPEAVRFLAQKVNIEIPELESNPQYEEKQKLRRQLRELYLEAARFYYLSLVNDPAQKANRYCDGRGISRRARIRFGLGYAPARWDGLYKHLQSKGLLSNPQLVEMSGLFKKGKNGSAYDLLRDRLIFPFLDAQGRVIAFGGRNLGPELPKYVNSPETPIYTKGDHLFGFNLAKKTTAPHLLLVEGYLDVVTTQDAGFDFTVGVLGTALTNRQAQLLRRVDKEVIVGFDADDAGQNAIMRSLDILEQEKLHVSVLVLPDGKDPDEYIKKHGADSFRALLGQTLSVMDYKMMRAERESMRHGILDKVAYQERVFEILLKEPNRVLVETRLSDLAMKLNVRLETVLREFQSRKPASERSRIELPSLPQTEAVPPSEPAQQVPAWQNRQKQELRFLALLFSHPGWMGRLKEAPAIDSFSSPELGALWGYLLQEPGENPGGELLAKLNRGLVELPRWVLDGLLGEMMNPEVDEAKEEVAQRYAYRILREQAVERMSWLSQQLTRADDPKQREELLYWSQKSIEYKNKLNR